ncbi:MAG: Ldh family oxidoreductase [Ahrensia sp.]|nr:Ldh family oxidoreductase [Ahrensia sp.]
MSKTYSSASLKVFAHAVLRGFGCDENEADIVADHLVEANLAGHDSHGIGVLPMYGDRVAAGHLKPSQTPVLNDPIGAISVVDARQGFGHRMALLAIDHAMKTLPQHKVAVLAMRNSGHVSRLGTYSEYCAARGCVSLHMVNVTGHPPLVAPFGARRPGFSTNPISIAMPGHGEREGQPHPMLDMATSTIAFGKVRVADNEGKQVPPGTLVDEEGVETRDPAPMARERIGALQAFGGHKGSGLGVFIELLTGALAGNGTVASAEDRPHMVINTLFSIILAPSAFDDPAHIAERTETYYDYVRALDPAKGVAQVLMPGDPENISRAERHASGIPVDDETIRQIIATGAAFGVEEHELKALLQTV